MKQKFYKEIEIPEGVEVKLEDSLLIVKGKEGENKRELNLNNISLEIQKGKVIIGNDKTTKNEKKRINTIVAHIQNMIKGVQEKFEYKLKICSSHFPMSVAVKDKIVEVKNFLGEKISRESKIPEGVQVKIQGQDITVTSTDKEIAGQAAANLETATKIRNRDTRIFQDGIYIINKAGKEI